MNANTTVNPQIGHYLVTTVDRWGVQTHRVGKDKRCTCGGTAKRRCRHIRAVATYLRDGGERAPEKRTMPDLRETDRHNPPPSLPAAVPESCPLCGGSIQWERMRLRRPMWRCMQDASHYFQWRGELNDGAIRKFLTHAHRAKPGAFYEQTGEERDAFLALVAERQRAGGYTPYA